MAGSKKNSSNNNQAESAEMDEISRYSTETAVVYFVFALIPILCVSYVYLEVYGMTIADYGLVYAPVILGSAVALTLGYLNLSRGTLARLLTHRRSSTINHKRLGLSVEAAGKQQAENTETESKAWAFFVVNTVFALSFLFIAFSMLKNVEVHYNYIAANGVSAILAWQVASVMSK